MVKFLVIGFLIFMIGLYALGYLSEASLRQVTLEEYTRSFIAMCERYVTEQVDSVRGLFR